MRGSTRGPQERVYPSEKHGQRLRGARHIQDGWSVQELVCHLRLVGANRGELEIWTWVPFCGEAVDLVLNEKNQTVLETGAQ